MREQAERASPAGRIPHLGVSVPTDATSPSSGTTDAAPSIADASTAAPSLPSLKGKTVLHTGDSMVGGAEGLSPALREKIEAEGGIYKKWYLVAVSLQAFSNDPKFPQKLARYNPDIVILTLGANDVFAPQPEYLAPVFKRIAKKIGTRECYWMSPPLWKPDTVGFVEQMKKFIAPCKLFDSSGLRLPRVGDGIHPTDEGGREWAQHFWNFFHDGATDAPSNVDGGPRFLPEKPRATSTKK